MKTITLIQLVLIVMVVACLVVSVFVASFWFTLSIIKRRTEKRECRRVRKAILESLKDGPLERGEILEWLEAQGICDESDGDYEIDNLLGDEFIEEDEESRYAQNSEIVIIDDEKRKIKITPKGKGKLLVLGKK